ncbi:valyl-tRNA synthetase [Ascodesmis nigricans]|uniref:valine--tRNA ligase n=1 Tax=Ascodesmis nigricans TaxID=341454 RepID=A0A4S2N7F4_9PEZI|nr:valyl-tRNA synthetase [Ascodesmis nigricans]
MPALTRWVNTPATAKSLLFRKPANSRTQHARLLWRPCAIRLVSTELPKKPKWTPGTPFTQPSSIEKGWYEYWDRRGCFEPSPDNRKQIRMLLPPPNVTGELHIGHALMVSIQDALARWYRMTGHAVKWAPGTDHAGIATQMVVERMLEQERGVKREELGREKFAEVVEEWRQKYGKRILGQIQRLGASTTNSQEYYTKDKPRSKAVTNAFVKLWEQGLIYRHTRMVNWCVKLQTAVSDIEVTTKEINGPTNIDRVQYGVIHKFAYPLVDGEGEVIIATTRPETIPGDRALAVHPDDERYKPFHYKYVRHPLFPDIKLPIIPDAALVNPEFGTGIVKVTPAHDANDYAFWLRNAKQSPLATEEDMDKRVDIPLVAVYNTRGRVTEASGLPWLVGQDRLSIRKRIVNLLKEKGFHRASDPHEMRLAICERSGSIIEPMLTPQWFMKMKPLAEKVIEVAEREGLKFVPAIPHAALWKRWLDGIEDWCLSRQIWWGHRIPAYMIIDQYKKEDNKVVRWVVAETYDHALMQLTADERSKGCIVKQDNDVLDTWFSSGLLPLSTGSWTGKSWAEQKQDNYPLDFIESGGDILFFWLARMALLCTWFTDKLPFNEIILHPLVCDLTGRKMSKSVGNVIDPLLIVNGRTHEQMVEDLQAEFLPRTAREGEPGLVAAAQLRVRIKELRKSFPKGFKEFGADSLRMALVDFTSRKPQINMDMRRVEFFGKLPIKIENAFRLFLQGHDVPWVMYDNFEIPPQYMELHDYYLLDRLSKLTATVNEAFQTRQLHNATTALRNFIWEDFCNLYLEMVKPYIKNPDPENEYIMRRRDTAMTMLASTWDFVFRLLHPFMPYLTETFWQAMWGEPRPDHEVLMLAPFPTTNNLPVVTASTLEDIKPMLRLIDSLQAYGNGKLNGVKLTHLNLPVIIPKGPGGEYITSVMAQVKSVTKSKGVYAVKEDDMGAITNVSDKWLVVWAEDERPGWTVWESPDTGSRVMMWGLETPGTEGKMRSLFTKVEGREKSIPPAL